MFKDIKVCVWYLNNIFIYGGDTKAKHKSIVEMVLQQCVKHRLVVNQFKSMFHIHGNTFLRHVIHG